MRYDFDTDLLALLPPWYAEIYDYQEICKTEKTELDVAADIAQTVSGNFFFGTMDEGTVSQWEKVLRITPSPETETLDFRRARVKNRLSTAPPFTLPFLRQKLNALIGEGNYTVTVDNAAYTLYIDMTAEDAQYSHEISATVEKIKPAHIVYRIRPQIFAGLLVGETVGTASYVWNYRLGAWGLGLEPFAGLSDSEVIVTAQAQSVQPLLINDTAQSISDSIAGAKINGTTTISAIGKTVAGGTVVVSYSVPRATAAEITSVALVDTNGDALTQATVYIPVDTEVTLKHTVTVEEATS